MSSSFLSTALLLLCAVAIANAQRRSPTGAPPKPSELFSDEVDSFFVGGDSAGAASIRRASPFPANLKPQVKVTNKGAPPEEDDFIEDQSPALFGQQPQQQQVAPQQAEDRRFTLSRDHVDLNSQGFSFPFVVDDPNRQVPGMTVERFPQEQMGPPRQASNTFNSGNSFFVPRQQQQQQNVGRARPTPHQQVTFPRVQMNTNDRRVVFRGQENENSNNQQQQDSRVFLPFNDDRQPTEQERPRFEERPKQFAVFQPENQQPSRGLVFMPKEPQAPLRSETQRPFVAQVARNFSNPPPQRANKPNPSSPSMKDRPLATKELDDFFQSSKEHIPIKTTQGINHVSTTQKPFRVATKGSVPVRGAHSFARPTTHEDEEIEEEDDSHSFRGNTGINPMFVDFSTLTTIPTTKTTSARRTTVSPWKTNTPRIRTVVHPPPQSAVTTTKRPRKRPMRIRTSTAKAQASSRSSVKSNAEANMFPGNDPTHAFVDVPRIGATRTKIRSSTRKPPTTLASRRTGFARNTEKVSVSTPSSRFQTLEHPNPKPRNEQKVSTARTRQIIRRPDVSTKDETATRVSSPQIFIPRRGSFEQNTNTNSVSSTQRNALIESDGNDGQESFSQRQGNWRVVKRPLRPRPEESSEETFDDDGDERFKQQHRPATHFRQQPSFLPQQRPQAPSSQPQLQQRELVRPPFRPRFRPSTVSNDYLDMEPPTEIDNHPTEAEDDRNNFRPSLQRPQNHATTPGANRFINPHIDEEDFPEGNSYEDNFDDEEYEDEPIPTTTTTKRPVRTRRPQSNFRLPDRSRPKPTTPRPASQSVRKPSRTQNNKNENSGSNKIKGKCHQSDCQLPYCYCGGTANPHDIPPEDMPQMVVLTFDDAINDLNWPLYQAIYFKDRTNPNGCPIQSTFYVSHEWTDYGKVETMYAAGHEIASHSISHQDGAGFSKQKWHDEIYGQKEILAKYGGVAMNDIQGMRAPFLAVGGNNMFGMLHEDNFTYDSSVTVLENNPPSWPYTLDYGMPHSCAIPPCPTQSFPGLWEIPMVSLTDMNGGKCSMADSCSYSTTADGVYEMLMKNFDRHYNSNKAPLGLYYHASWFLIPHRKEAFIKFLDEILKQDDVYLITAMQLIEWMRNPTPLSKIKNFEPWLECRKKKRQPACRHSRECNIPFRGDIRPFRTCGECPNVYPWVGKTNV